MADTKKIPAIKRALTIGLTGLVVIVVYFGGITYLVGRFSPDRPVDYQDDVEHFKYGSLGSEHEFGVPYCELLPLQRLRVREMVIDRLGICDVPREPSSRAA